MSSYYQRDIVADVEPQLARANPNTLRRHVIDIAGKIVKSGRVITLKVADDFYGDILKRIWDNLSSKKFNFSFQE